VVQSWPALTAQPFCALVGDTTSLVSQPTSINRSSYLLGITAGNSDLSRRRDTRRLAIRLRSPVLPEREQDFWERTAEQIG
jgi:hypothetical protein